MRCCIDIGVGSVWTSFCGRIIDSRVINAEDHGEIELYYLSSYIRYKPNSPDCYHKDWCEDCVNDPRLHLAILDHLEL